MSIIVQFSGASRLLTPVYRVDMVLSPVSEAAERLLELHEGSHFDLLFFSDS